jgi:hypothetical protein
LDMAQIDCSGTVVEMLQELFSTRSQKIRSDLEKFVRGTSDRVDLDTDQYRQEAVGKNFLRCPFTWFGMRLAATTTRSARSVSLWQPSCDAGPRRRNGNG